MTKTKEGLIEQKINCNSFERVDIGPRGNWSIKPSVKTQLKNPLSLRNEDDDGERQHQKTVD